MVSENTVKGHRPHATYLARVDSAPAIIAQHCVDLIEVSSSQLYINLCQRLGEGNVTLKGSKWAYMEDKQYQPGAGIHMVSTGTVNPPTQAKDSSHVLHTLMSLSAPQVWEDSSPLLTSQDWSQQVKGSGRPSQGKGLWLQVFDWEEDMPTSPPGRQWALACFLGWAREGMDLGAGSWAAAPHKSWDRVAWSLSFCSRSWLGWLVSHMSAGTSELRACRTCTAQAMARLLIGGEVSRPGGNFLTRLTAFLFEGVSKWCQRVSARLALEKPRPKSPQSNS